ncbi:uncharacterized protein G2W53_044170 [Senna tora]|uniref:Uncharacterized protein n=1 Tax=Senna tora TaxID=362788 RepID=A0A834SJV5_9FABA|nr:uncharacterized protein G2W53_044170 [Senna tora]
MELQAPSNNGESQNPDPKSEPPNPNNAHDPHPSVFEDFDSTCSTPYVSAPSSPGRGPISGFFYSAPASPMHFALTSASLPSVQSSSSSTFENMPLAYEFEFSARFGFNGSGGSGSMSSADELFLNGQIRPMKLSTHLERPQVLAPLLDLEGEEEEDEEAEVGSHVRGRDLRLRDKSVRRRTRSMSPLRSTPSEWAENEEGNGDLSLAREIIDKSGCSEIEENEREKIDGLGIGSGSETTPSVSASSSRSSSAGRSSKRWVFLKDFLRSKSEGRSNNKFWSTISFSPVKDKKASNHNLPTSNASSETPKSKMNTKASAKRVAGKPANGVGKRRVPPSPHELHYKAHRAQAEEMRKKTFLPYRQGLLGCLGFSSKGYGAMNGFARALNPVSSRYQSLIKITHESQLGYLSHDVDGTRLLPSPIILVDLEKLCTKCTRSRLLFTLAVQ